MNEGSKNVKNTTKRTKKILRDITDNTEKKTEILGCSFDEVYKYLLSTWEKNYGKPWDGGPYHIDHIIPLATAKTEEEAIKLCHYTNLQLLTPEDNMVKNAKVYATNHPTDFF